MRLRDGLITSSVDGEHIAVATGELSKQFHGMVVLNKTGQFLWDKLAEDQTEESLVAALCAKYQVGRADAHHDVRRFLDSLSEAGLLVRD